MDGSLFLLITVHLIPAFLLFANLNDARVQSNVIQSALLSFTGFVVAYKLIPSVAALTKAAGMHGIDLNKKKGPTDKGKSIPEGLGLATGTTYLVCMILFQAFQFFQFPESTSLSEYNAALTSICFILLLGFSDDVLNLRWRYKLVLPAVATLPLLVAYAGGTAVVVPVPLRFLLGKVLELGLLYRLYLLLLAIFCTNSINILAGINGLEVGQSFIIATSIITHNLLELYLNNCGSPTTTSTHSFSLYLMLPYIATTIALLLFNWYPSQVFVGDTYTYFSGMSFAVVAILCHFSKTLLLFFIPQILNFIISLPQLFNIIPCPRHRLPSYNPRTGKLEYTRNLTLLNFFLYIFGPMHEKTLCVVLLAFQSLCCITGFMVRYYVASYFFD
jgi:UDP-N-acetylglucosamine--dolichyl-phosphate N-acetylglucosaminephosphotransferase